LISCPIDRSRSTAGNALTRYAFHCAGDGKGEDFDKCLRSKSHGKFLKDPKNAAGKESCILFFCFEGGANPFSKDDGNFSMVPTKV
jgi:hypothetical protein